MHETFFFIFDGTEVDSNEKFKADKLRFYERHEQSLLSAVKMFRRRIQARPGGVRVAMDESI